MHQSFLGIDKPTTGQDEAHTKLLDHMQKTDNKYDEIGYVLKYRKDREGNDMSVNMASVMLKDAAGEVTKLMESTKSMKALIPKKVKTDNP